MKTKMKTSTSWIERLLGFLKPRRSETSSAQKSEKFDLAIPWRRWDQKEKVSENPPISFRGIFGNDHPVEVEIGCGKGRFLIARSEREPGMNFLGIDWAAKWMGVAHKRGSKRNLANLKFVRGEAAMILEQIVPQSVSAFHIYFPDPWPKRRHHRRRFVTAKTLARIHELLLPGGLLEIATDDADYYGWMKNALVESRIQWAGRRETVNQRIAYPELKTSYELKFEAEKRPLYYLELKK